MSKQVNARDAAVLTQIVERCCRLKADVVEQDEREETGLRSILNYGHTFCHAFEAATGYEQLLHGEGVAIGMMCAARLAERLGRVDAAFVERQQKLLEAFKMPLDVPDVDHDELDRADVSRQESGAREVAVCAADTDGARGARARRDE